ncbi:type II CAAX prenyl endopeptidase Rce1 family protein [Clostridium rectalis]|uniref:CPBP family glutamic-type intramembrane protease n=1 Tax=Clostridium rectalis TaxID=2040295 RepID=UPI000F633D3F|nr:CPBP family glutamic-type intramembrane protease [Clostridium rectalis]
MKKSSKQFLLISFFISYLCFGIIIHSNIKFNQVFNSPLYLIIFILGCLGPFISALTVHILNKENLGGIKGFTKKLITIKKTKTIVLIPIFLIAHFLFAMLFRGVYRYGKIIDFFRYLPIMLLIIGSQEIGWRGIVQPANEDEKGFWKSSIVTGLFWSLWFLPLIFIPNFIVLPQFYMHFSAYLVGISILSTTLYKISENILYCIILSSFIFALFPVIVLKQNYILIGIALVDAIIATTFKDKTLSKRIIN